MKTVVITGASRGIGRALAERFLANGDSVIGSSRTGQADFQDSNLRILPMELTDDASRQRFADTVRDLNRPIDIFINNAGMWHDNDEGPVVDLEALRQTLEADLVGPVDLAQKLVSLMAPGSHIINVSSRRGSCSFTEDKSDQPPGRCLVDPAYSIAKAGLNMFTRKLAVRLKDKATVSSVHPGSVKTDMNPGGEITSQEAAEDIFKLANSSPETGQFWFKGEKFSW